MGADIDVGASREVLVDSTSLELFVGLARDRANNTDGE